MTRCWMAVVAVLALWSAPALAQPVFYDDFEGDALLPHWNQPPPSHWEYNVSNSMLNVTNLLYPSNPHAPGNFAWMSALYAPQTDFRIDVWMGWEAGQDPHRLALQVLGPGGNPILATFGYAHEAYLGPDPVIFAQTNQPPIARPAPAPGMQHFTISRIATRFDFYLNDALFFSGTGSNIQAGALAFDFVGPYPGQVGAFHIDRVQVVPAPGTLGLAVALSLASACRRKRRTVCAI